MQELGQSHHGSVVLRLCSSSGDFLGCCGSSKSATVLESFPASFSSCWSQTRACSSVSVGPHINSPGSEGDTVQSKRHTHCLPSCPRVRVRSFTTCCKGRALQRASSASPQLMNSDKCKRLTNHNFLWDLKTD